MVFEISKVSSFEALQILTLINQHYDAPEHLKVKTVKELYDKIAKDNAKVGVIKENDEIVTVSFYKKMTDHLVMTYWTIVHKAHRKKRLAYRINEEFEKIFKQQGFKKVMCDIYTDNLPSLFLKLKRGYLVEGLRKNHDLQDVHEYTLGKEI